MKRKHGSFNQFKFNCINAPNVRALCDMIDSSKSISAKQFRKMIGSTAFKQIEKDLGYGIPRSLTLSNDYSVSFYSSYYKNKPCYYVKCSAIEYVFMQP